MIKTMEEMEEKVLSAEEEEEEGEEEEEQDHDGDVDDEAKEAEVKTGAADKKIQPAAKKKNKAPSNVLNLNNEVVKMRKEVKRVRALIIRKLTRQIASLKKKKGKEMAIDRNQRRAARLLEEVHAMKELSPDLVTKTALQKNLNFEKVCKNPKSTISDRAIARVATHPQFSKKIDDIKAAVKAFKEDRMKGRKPEEKGERQAEKMSQECPNKPKSESEEERCVVKPQMVTDDDIPAGKDIEETAVAEKEEEFRSEAPVVVHETTGSKSVKPAVLKKDSEKDKIQIEAPEKQPNLQADLEESDLELSDEEKEYFDDSTEERFRKQSSQSEESEDDDFFLGKVSKFKRKKKKKDEGPVAKEEVKKDSTDKLQKELDELESRLKSKANPLQSVFCSSLTGAGRGGATGRGGSTGRGRGDRFRGGGGKSSDFSRQEKFQKQQKGPEGNAVSSKQRPPESDGKGFAFSGRGRGRGRGEKGPRGRGAFSHHALQEVLHPSWEASKKRKEQQGQILAFQGKKIKFDDDD